MVDSRGGVALAVDVSPDRSTTTVAASGWATDGLPFVEVIGPRRGEPDWALHRIDLWGQHDIPAVAIEAISADNTLIDPLRRAGVTVAVNNASATAKACGGLFDAVAARSVSNLDQPALKVARNRRIGDGGFVWSRQDPESDITPLIGATLALWGLPSSQVAAKPRKRSGKATFV